MPELDRVIAVRLDFRRILGLPEGDRWHALDGRLFNQTQTTMYVSLHDNSQPFNSYATTGGADRVRQWNVEVSPARGAAIAALFTGARVTVGPAGQDGVVLPNRVRVQLGIVSGAVFTPGRPELIRAGVLAADRWLMTFAAPVPAGVGDSTAPASASYTWRDGDEMTIEQHTNIRFSTWCSILSEIASDALVLTTGGDVDITDQRIDVRLRVRRDTRFDAYATVILVGTEYEVISVAEDLTLGRNRYQLLGLRRTQARSE